MDADVFISLTHFKGHEMTGFGGAIKNIGMGCGSRAGKMDQHADGKPVLDAEACRGCRRCAKECGSDAISYVNNKAVIDYDKCKGCGRCIGACTFDAISSPDDSANEMLDRKMAEYAQAVCQDRPASTSPGAGRQSELRLPWRERRAHPAGYRHVRQLRPPSPWTRPAPTPAWPPAHARQPALRQPLQPRLGVHHDHFKDSNPNIEWKATLEQAEKIGLGTRAYELKKI